MTDIDRIREFIKVQRNYASFFEWYKREKSIKEVGVVKLLLKSLWGHGADSYQNPRASKSDPPDVIAKTIEGATVGFEVRELVDQKAVELNERGKAVYRDWTDSEVVKEVQKIIDEKDSKKYIGGPFEKLIIVIPTDEPLLTVRLLKPVLDKHEFRQPRQLHEAYLLFSYDPNTKSYPYVRLRLTANKTLEPTS